MFQFDRILIVSFLLITMSANMLPAEEEAKPTTQPAQLPAGQPLDLFLLIGQSNMAGRAVPEAEDRTIHPRVWTLAKTGEWVPAKAPIHFDKPHAVGVGPGLSFGKVIAGENTKVFVGLIPCAVGGTSIDQWEKGGCLYEAAVRRAKIAMTHGRLKGILWHQGEADCDSASVKAYPEKFIQLVRDLRSDLNAPNVPVIVGQLGSFRKPSPIEFNKMLVTIPQVILNCACVSAEKLKDKGDGRHFSADSQREFGRRYAAAYLRLLSAK